MGDAGEGLVDAEGRIQERMEELAQERARKSGNAQPNPELQRAVESLRLARTELTRQLNATTHPGRRAQLTLALNDIDRRIAPLQNRADV